ncbi:hypothetical protein [Streptomyces sp. NRRL S-495]|uniref:hypothetical protein n=1 Tax=Streptomyces sp. NRRL S-495 TaxID=1609133 RepID=UPI0005F9A38A|nr:hypothetical protein [Streptomyces sp. NRRL S-495]KJY29473.1 hypothetical protein VR45_29855 [Streptomyces sp. NRRL S-495]
MSTRTADAKPPTRRRPAGENAVRALAHGLFLLAGLATTVLGFSWFVDANEEAGAYRTAPACGTAAHTPGTDCVRHETGTVTARGASSVGDGTVFTLTVARGTGSGHRYTVDSDLYHATKVGADVDLTLYRGRVAEVSHDGARTSHSGTAWVASLEVALLVGLGAALTVIGLTWTRFITDVASFAFAMGGFTAVMAFVGSLTLVPSQLPLAATLAFPVLGWLGMTLLPAVIVRSD